jgi:hypothetical protein
MSDKLIITDIHPDEDPYKQSMERIDYEVDIVIFDTAESGRSIAMSYYEFPEFVKACQRFLSTLKKEL